MTQAVRRPLVAVLAALALAAAAWAAPGPSSSDKKAESGAEKINKALDAVGNWELNTNLQDALQKLADEGKFNIVLDRITLINQLSIDPSQTPVSVKLSGVKMRSALRSVLSQYNLGYAIVGDLVVVTTEDQAVQRQLRQRVTIDLDKVPAATALRQLSKETGTNLLLDSRVGKEAQGAVTLQVDDVPLETAAKLIAEMAGLKTVRVGNVLFVTDKATAQEMRQDPDLQGGQTGAQATELDLMNRDQQQLLKQLLPQQAVPLQQLQPLQPAPPPPIPKQ